MLSPLATSQIKRPTPWWGRFRRTNTHHVGIDIGIDVVKVSTFGIKLDPETHRHGVPALEWLSQSEFRLPIDPQSPPPPEWVELIVQLLRDRLPRCVDGDQNSAVIALPTPWIHYQNTLEAEFSASERQCDSMFEGSIFQSRANLSRWPVVGGKDQYVVAATAESAACRIAEAIAEVGYQVQGILPHGVALLHAAPALTSLQPSAVLLLELSGGLVALRNELGCGLCRNLPPCSIATGEQPCLDEIEPWLQEIALEVQATFRYAARLSGNADTQSPILICGRAGNIAGADAILANTLARPVATWRYAGRSRPGRHASILDPQNSDSGLAVSLSLACCGIQGFDSGRRHER